MAPGDGLLRSEELVGDGSGSVKRGSTARNCTVVCGHQGGNRDGRARAETGGDYAHRTTWKPEGGVRGVGDSKGGDPREDGQQIEQRRDVVRRKPR